MPDDVQPAPVPVMPVVDQSAADVPTLVDMGLMDPPPVPSPEPPPPPTYD